MILPTPKNRYKVALFRLVAFTVPFVTTGAIAWYFMTLSVAPPDRIVKSALTRNRIIDPDHMKLFLRNERYGWSLKRSTQVRHVTNEFDVVYTTDSQGFRVTPDPKSPIGTVVCLGGSFTFGHGVEDDEAWPFLLGKSLSEYKVINCAVQAWGPSQSYLRLQSLLERDNQPVHVVYGWIQHHVKRNTPNRDWVGMQGNRRHPLLAMKNNQLVLSRLVGAEVVEEETDDVAVTVMIMREISRLCRMHAVPFSIVAMPMPDNYPVDIGPDILDELKSMGIDIIDARSARGGFFSQDLHPKPEMHVRIAEITTRCLVCKIGRLNDEVR